MSINETRSQDNTVITIVSNDAEIIGDTPDWGGPLTECGRYGELTGYNYVRCPMYGVEVLDSETPTVSHRPVCRYK